MRRVLLIDGDGATRDAVGSALGQLGHHVHAVATAGEGLACMGRNNIDIVVLDLVLPDMGGLDVCRRVRASSHTPVIILTDRAGDADVVAGLRAGADDYVVRPVSPEVLDARVHAVLRRAQTPLADEVQFGDLVIDRTALTVSKCGEPVRLAPSELRLLLELSASPGQVFSRQQLLEMVWEHHFLGDSRMIDTCVQRLRAKIEDDPRSPRYVQTVRGFGYRFGPL
ncbi:DNA-binding response regulator [Longimycelium tulufanense]|uniref:DNA-binding response regulator n=1 Tax=Longimycelium tulufanense TaxID=907463 RepID=A0A8J3FUP6_9PSEU|nr:response regulator transcription factor [Longimycelium tulufanense]GGM37046.1 DNA-binding response regulator [Longimycelium tulufanense]